MTTNSALHRSIVPRGAHIKSSGNMEIGEAHGGSYCALQTGNMFGKGIYFADMVTKSAQYCSAPFGALHNSNALLLLCDVALGKVSCLISLEL